MTFHPIATHIFSKNSPEKRKQVHKLGVNRPKQLKDDAQIPFTAATQHNASINANFIFATVDYYLRFSQNN